MAEEREREEILERWEQFKPGTFSPKLYLCEDCWTVSKYTENAEGTRCPECSSEQLIKNQ